MELRVVQGREQRGGVASNNWKENDALGRDKNVAFGEAVAQVQVGGFTVVESDLGSSRCRCKEKRREMRSRAQCVCRNIRD